MQVMEMLQSVIRYKRFYTVQVMQMLQSVIKHKRLYRMQMIHMLQWVTEHKHLYTSEYIFLNMWKYSSVQSTVKMRPEKSIYVPPRLSEVSPTLPLKNVNVSIHLRQTTWICVYAIYMWISYTLCRLLVYINSCKKNTYARYSSFHHGEVYVIYLLLIRMPGGVYVPCIYLHAKWELS